jgi:hypothetical protein
MDHKSAFSRETPAPDCCLTAAGGGSGRWHRRVDSKRPQIEGFVDSCDLAASEGRHTPIWLFPLLVL